MILNLKLHENVEIYEQTVLNSDQTAAKNETTDRKNRLLDILSRNYSSCIHDILMILEMTTEHARNLSKDLISGRTIGERFGILSYRAR